MANHPTVLMTTWRFSVALLLCASALAVGAQSPPAVDSAAVGLWWAEHMEGPAVRGELTVDVRGTEYRARVAGFDVPVTRNGNSVQFKLPGINGEFRGTLSDNARAIAGHWVQPAGYVSFQPRATPLELIGSSSRSWIGQIVPLEERAQLYVQIRRENGKLLAAIRIPANNRFGNETFAVEVKQNEIVLTGTRGTLRGSYDSRSDRLLLTLAGSSPQVFTRRNQRNAVGFYPRTPWPVSYSYRRPDASRDGWQTASLKDTALDSRPIEALMQSILDADPSDPSTVPIHSILIARRGKLAVEEYFHGFDRDRPHDTRSAGKTFAPLLVGVARAQGAKIEPQTLLSDVLPQYRPFANGDERKSKLTVEHIMTMTSGLACDDNDPSSPGAEGRMQSQQNQPDWYKYTVDLPMVRDPGGATAVYCSADLNLVGGVAGAAAGVWNGDLFSRFVARPMAFGTYHLNLMPTGDAYMGGGVYLRPRDALKLGQLYLNGGLWNGARIVGKEWVDRSTASHAAFARPVIDIDLNHEYGYGWHIHHFTSGGRTYRQFAAEGNGGQFIMVFPELDMVVAINSGKYASPLWYRWGLEVVAKYLIPAAAGRISVP